MGAYASCMGGDGPQLQGSAMMITDATSAPERWTLPAEVNDVLIQHPLHEVIDGDKFLKKGIATPMGYSEPLKNKKVYFLVPVNNEGMVQPNLSLSQIKGLKKLMTRGGRKRVLPLQKDIEPDEELGFEAL